MCEVCLFSALRLEYVEAAQSTFSHEIACYATPQVLDVNDPPTCTSSSSPYSVRERSAGGVVVASLEGSEVTDKDGTLSAYAILYGNDEGLFMVNASTGVVVVSLSSSGFGLDFERKSQYVLVVQATDPGGLDCSVEVRRWRRFLHPSSRSAPASGAGGGCRLRSVDVCLPIVLDWCPLARALCVHLAGDC